MPKLQLCHLARPFRKFRYTFIPVNQPHWQLLPTTISSETCAQLNEADNARTLTLSSFFQHNDFDLLWHREFRISFDRLCCFSDKHLLAGDIVYADYWLKEIQGFLLPNTSVADGFHA